MMRTSCSCCHGGVGEDVAHGHASWALLLLQWRKLVVVVLVAVVLEGSQDRRVDKQVERWHAEVRAR